MAKSLKDLFELYRPKAGSEQKFVDKHVAIKHKDRNGNGDDVFKATNIKAVPRATEHGYDPGQDEKVYEDVEQIDEISRATKDSYTKKATAQRDHEINKIADAAYKAHPGHDGESFDRAEDQIDREASKNNIIRKRRVGLKLAKEKPSPKVRKAKSPVDHKAMAQKHFALAKKAYASADKHMGSKSTWDKAQKYTDSGDAHTNKAQSYMDKHNKLKEDVEQIDELGSTYSAPAKVPQRRIKAPAAKKVAAIADKKGMSDKDVENVLFKQGNGRKSAQMIKGFRGAPQKLLAKEDVINRTIEKYMPEISEYENLTNEEKMIYWTQELPESQIKALHNMFTNLSEDNQLRMIGLLTDPDNVNELLDLAISSRGE